MPTTEPMLHELASYNEQRGLFFVYEGCKQVLGFTSVLADRPEVYSSWAPCLPQSV